VGVQQKHATYTAKEKPASTRAKTLWRVLHHSCDLARARVSAHYLVGSAHSDILPSRRLDRTATSKLQSTPADQSAEPRMDAAADLQSAEPRMDAAADLQSAEPRMDAAADSQSTEQKMDAAADSQGAEPRVNAVVADAVAVQTETRSRARARKRKHASDPNTQLNAELIEESKVEPAQKPLKKPARKRAVNSKPPKPTRADCDVCDEACRHTTTCRCGATVCRACVRQGLLSTIQDPCCLQCRAPLSIEDLGGIAGKSRSACSLTL